MQFLIDELDLQKIIDRDKLVMVEYIINQALEKEKEQTLDFTRGAIRMILDEDRTNPFNLEEYYNQTYNK